MRNKNKQPNPNPDPSSESQPVTFTPEELQRLGALAQRVKDNREVIEREALIAALEDRVQAQLAFQQYLVGTGKHDGDLAPDVSEA